jgi:lysophospholipase L1-like esterase
MKRSWWAWGGFAAIVGVVAAIFIGRAAFGASGFLIEKGDTPIVFFGDSITQDADYVRMIDSFLLTRYPDREINVVNLGVNGDTAGLRRRGGYRRTNDRDIKTIRPKVAFLCFGMNDARGEAEFAEYPEAINRLAGALEGVGSKVVILSPTAEQGDERGWLAGSSYNTRLARLMWECKKIAEQRKATFVDLHTMFVLAIEMARINGIIPENGDSTLIPDKVHPASDAHLLVACTILKALHPEGFVSEATIDAATRRVTSGRGCTVDISGTSAPGELEFSRLDRCLPWPLPDNALTLSLQIPGFHSAIDELSGCWLKIVNLLPERQYTLTIDGIPAGTYTAEHFSRGVNLTLVEGPIREQTRKIYALVTAKSDLWRTRYRDVQLYNLPVWARPKTDDAPGYGAVSDWLETRRLEEMTRIDAELASKRQELSELKKPVMHRFSVRPSVAQNKTVRVPVGP